VRFAPPYGDRNRKEAVIVNANPREAWEHYVASWKAESIQDKRALFERCLAPECVYTDPLTRAEGYDELLAYMANFHRQVPGGHFVTLEFVFHHGRSMAKWQMVSAGGSVIGDGVSYGEYDDTNRLIVMTGFFETPATEP
jgi:hypothetical protein